MNKNELLKFLQAEESKSITGWDFSYLDGRWDEESLPWDYKKIILEYLKPDHQLLDIGTGGGEFLLSLNHLAFRLYPSAFAVHANKKSTIPINANTANEQRVAPQP